jgi:putative RNA 2'-phosphotransferase
MTDRQRKISKYLSYHLRHHPEKLGLMLESGGWVRVDELLAAAKQNDFPITEAELQEVVANNEKQRFSFDETHLRIRANQGHSVTVDLQLTAAVPPDVLYHGTAGKTAIESIGQEGLRKMSRHHVHLSADTDTAKKVGQRRGKPVIFQIDAAAMHRDGYVFYCSDNGVWLVDRVPPDYLVQM